MAIQRMWQGLQTITVYKVKTSHVVDTDVLLPYWPCPLQLGPGRWLGPEGRLQHFHYADPQHKGPTRVRAQHPTVLLDHPWLCGQECQKTSRTSTTRATACSPRYLSEGEVSTGASKLGPRDWKTTSISGPSLSGYHLVTQPCTLEAAALCT